MAHFAEINPDDNTVIRVKVIHNCRTDDGNGGESEELGIAFCKEKFGGEVWKQTSYNTSAGEHKNGGTPLRGNYCGEGYTYHPPPLDIFSPPKLFPSWDKLDPITGQWIPPVPYPEVEAGESEIPPVYLWNENDQTWDEVEMPSE